MSNQIKAIAYVILAIALLAATPYLVKLLFIPFRGIHNLLYIISGLTAIIGLPIYAYNKAKNETDPNHKWVLIAFAVWIFCLSKTNDADLIEKYEVTGVTEFGGGDRTRTYVYHNYKDAVHYAEELYKEKNDWCRDDDGKFQTADVKIEVSSHRPSLMWFNKFFNKFIGFSHYTTSIRKIKNNEDPLNLSSEYESDYDDASRFDYNL